MKTIKKISKQFFSLLFIAALILGCSKDGNDGAVGPQGAQGEQGPAGPQGDAGEDGETGTANVIYSEWFATEFGNNITEASASFDVEVPEIDNEILTSGVILVYGQRLDGSTSLVYQLPIVFGAGRQQSYYFVSSIGNIRISVAANETGGSVLAGDFLEKYRYVIIPGGVQSSSKSSSSINYSKMTYEEILRHFNIPE